MEIGVVKIS